jgi:hypothetical protein
MRYEIQQLTLGQILDRAILLMRNHLKLLLGIAGYMYIPVLLVITLISVYMAPDLPPTATPQEVMAAQLEHMKVTVIIALIQIFVFLGFVEPLTTAAATWAISREYLDQPTTAGQAFRAAVRIFGRILLTGLLKGVIVVIGILLFVFPGILFVFWYFLSSQVVVIEEKSGWEALRRSKQLMRGNIGTAFVLNLLLGLIMAVACGLAAVVPTKVGNAVGQVLVQSVAYMLFTAALVVFYFHCRTKAEHFDLQQLAEAVAVPPPPPDAAGGMPPPIPPQPIV